MDSLGQKKHCIICEENKETGYFILQSFICVECENDIVHTDTSSPYYSFLVQQLKKLNQIPIST